MGYFDDYSKYLNELGDSFSKNTALKMELGLTKNSDYYQAVETALKSCEIETLLHIADELKRIADSLEKLTTPLSFYEEDKGARKEEENKENDTN